MPVFKFFASVTSGDDTPPVVFGLRSKKRHKVVLDGESSISSIPMAFNPYENERYVDRMISRTFPDVVEPGTASAIKRDLMSRFASIIKRELPVTKTIANGVYVTTISKADLQTSEILKLYPRENMLEAAQLYFAYDGFIPQGTAQNSILDNDKGILSFNASVGLMQVIADGRRGDILINNVGFIIDLGERYLLISPA